MTMDLRVGLVGRGMDGTGKVTAWQQSGPEVSADAEFVLADRGDAVAVADQLLGLAEDGSGAPVVPVEWENEPGRNGFYRVTAVDLSFDRPLVNVHKVKAKLGLVRVAGSSSLAGEHILWGADRAAAPTSGSWAGNEPNPWVCWPSTWGIAADVFGVVNPSPQARPLSPTLSAYTLLNFGSVYNTSVLTSPTPATYYDAACTVRTGSPLQYVTGRRQVIDPRAFELSNGLVKVTAPSVQARSFELKYRNAAGTAWSTRARAFGFWGDVTYTDFTAGIRPNAVTVTRNTPEVVVARLAVPVAYTEGIVYLDLTLRRGSRFLQVALSAGYASQWALGHQTGFNGAWGGIDLPTVGSIETNSDVDGNRSLLILGSVRGAGVAFNNQGRVLKASANYNEIEVAIGAEVGATPIAYDEAAYLERQYMAAVGEVFRVVRP